MKKAVKKRIQIFLMHEDEEPLVLSMITNVIVRTEGWILADLTENEIAALVAKNIVMILIKDKMVPVSKRMLDTQNTREYLVWIRGPFCSGWQNEFKQLGVTLIERCYGSGYYKTSMTPDQAIAVNKLSFVGDIRFFKSKLCPEYDDLPRNKPRVTPIN